MKTELLFTKFVKLWVNYNHIPASKNPKSCTGLTGWLCSITNLFSDVVRHLFFVKLENRAQFVTWKRHLSYRGVTSFLIKASDLPENRTSVTETLCSITLIFDWGSRTCHISSRNENCLQSKKFSMASITINLKTKLNMGQTNQSFHIGYMHILGSKFPEIFKSQTKRHRSMSH